MINCTLDFVFFSCWYQLFISVHEGSEWVNESLGDGTWGSGKSIFVGSALVQNICWICPRPKYNVFPVMCLYCQFFAVYIGWHRGLKCIASQIMLHIPPIWRNPAHKSHINFPQKENGGKSGEINVQLSPRQRGFVGETWWSTLANGLWRGLCCTYWGIPLFYCFVLSAPEGYYLFLDKAFVCWQELFTLSCARKSPSRTTATLPLLLLPTPRIALFVGWLLRHRKVPHHRCMNHSRFVHHTCMNQGSRNIGCIRITNQGS